MSILDDLRQLVLQASERLMEAALDEAVLSTAEASPAPMSGDLARSIKATPASATGQGFTATLVATAEHASYTDLGTGIHPPGGRGSPIVASDYGLKAFVFHWPSYNAPNGPGVYAFAKVNGIPAQFWWITHHPERWTRALELASQRGAFSTG